MFIKSTSWFSSKTNESFNKPTRKRQVAPCGCFSVYVGPEKQRFVIKTEFLNHSLFKMLLEDVELEYGFSCEGPLEIPCEVDLFCNILAEMSSGEELLVPMGCGYGSFSPFSPARHSRKSTMVKAA